MDKQLLLKLYKTQELELAKAVDARYKLFRQALEAARYDLYSIVSAPDTWASRRKSNLIKQISNIEKQLNKSIKDIGNSADALAPLTLDHLRDSMKMIVPDVGIKLSLGVLNTDTLYEFSQNSLNQVTSIQAVQLKTVRAVMFSKIGVQGQNPNTVAKLLAGEAGIFAKKYAQIENVVRTETSTVYNTQSMNGIEYVNRKYDLALNKRIVETIDSKRNHPISQILNGQIQEYGKPFKASVAAVKAKAKQLGHGLKKDGTVGGVFWDEIDGYFVGDRLPAHYFERGIVVPSLESVNI